MNEDALIKIQSIVIGLDRHLHKLVKELISNDGLINDEQLTIMINSTERELRMYEHILNLLINNQEVN